MDLYFTASSFHPECPSSKFWREKFGPGKSYLEPNYTMDCLEKSTVYTTVFVEN